MDSKQMAQDVLGELIEVLSDAVMERVGGKKLEMEEDMGPPPEMGDDLDSRLMAASSMPGDEEDMASEEDEESPFPNR